MRVTLLSALLCVLTSSASAQESERPIAAGELTPASAQIWVRLQGLTSLRAALNTHVAGKALESWRKGKGGLARKWTLVETALCSFLEQSGLDPKLLSEGLDQGAVLALYSTPKGRGFSGHIHLSSKAEELLATLQGQLQQQKSEGKEQGTASWGLSLPLGFPGKIWLRRHEGRLFFASSTALLEQLSQLQAGHGESLASDPAFRNSFGERPRNETGTWAQAFVRGQVLGQIPSEEAWWTVLSKLGLCDIPGLAWTSTWKEDRFHDRIGLALADESGAPFHFLSEEALSEDMAHLVPKLAERYLALRILPQELLQRLGDSECKLPGGFTIQELVQQLQTKHAISSREELLALLGNELLLIGDPALGKADMIAVSLIDSFRTQKMLEKLTGAIPPEGETPLFTLLGKSEQNYFAAVHGDHLLLTSKKELMDAWLSDLRNGQVLSAADPQAWDPRCGPLSGQESGRCLLLAADPQRKLGLAELAAQASTWNFALSHGKKRLELSCESATGPIVALGLGMARELPVLLHHRTASNEALARELTQQLGKAQQAWLTLKAASGDETKKGPATVKQLVDAGLFPAKAAELDEHDILTRSGYRYHFTLQTGSGSSWIALAWPQQPGITGRTCFAHTQEGLTLRHPWVAGLDEAQGPSLGQIYSGTPFASKPRSGWRQGSSMALPEVTATADIQQAKPKDKSVKKEELALDKYLRLVDAYAESKEREELRLLLADKNPAVQARAAHRLGELGDQESVPLLARLARESSDAELRRRATWSLSRMRDPRTAATLLSLLADEDAKVRVFAVQGLSTGQAPGIDEALVDLAQTYPQDEAGERSLAVLVLGDRKQSKVLPELSTLQPSGERFANALTSTFQRLTPELKPKEEARVLILALNSPIERLRLYAIERLAEAGYTSAIPALIARQQEESGPLALRIEEALNHLQPESGIDIEAIGEKVRAEAKVLWARFQKQPKDKQLVIALTPLLLLISLTLLGLFRRRRKARRRGSSSEAIRDLVAPSDDLIQMDEEEEMPGGSEIDEVPSLIDFETTEQTPLATREAEELNERFH